MAILRCSKCGHVAEAASEYIGKAISCPHCGNETPVYDTVLFVRKVLQQYFALQDEVKTLRAALPATSLPSVPESPALTEIDIHNTASLASDAQHQGILQWFQRRQIQIRTDTRAVDTTGFFDDIAVELGDDYKRLREVVDKIRWGQQKDVPHFSLKLSDHSQKDGQAINAFCKRLYEYSFLAKYFYQKQDKLIRVTIQSAPAVRSFFSGEWLEWYALMKLLAFFRDRGRAFSCTRNLKVTFANEDLHELDVFFLVDDATPVMSRGSTKLAPLDPRGLKSRLADLARRDDHRVAARRVFAEATHFDEIRARRRRLEFEQRVQTFAAIIVALSWLLATYKGLPNVLIIMFVLMVAYDFVTSRTTIGRRIYALGGNEKAARLSGIRTERLAFYTFVNMGVLAALAGLVFAARLNTATPKAGLGFELDVIAACFIGGASASGGVGKVMGAVIGAFVMGVMNNGMSILGIGIDYQQVIKGLVLLAAVCLDVYNKNK